MTLETIPVKIGNSIHVSGTIGENTDYFVDAEIDRQYTERNGNPDYKVRISKKQDASTYYNRQSIEYQSRLCAAKVFIPTGANAGKTSSYSGRWASDYAGLWGPNRFNTDVEAIALTKLKRRLQEATGQFNAAVPTAEIRELRGLIRQTMTLSTDLVLSLLEAKKTKGASIVKYAADKWLYYNFGCRPLISDTIEVAKSIAAFNTRRERTVVQVGKHTGNFSFSMPRVGRAGAPFSTSTYFDITGNEEISYKFIAGMSLDVMCANDYSIADHLGFMPRSLPSIGWELMMYSWMFDYFGTVGDWLSDEFNAPSGTTTYVVRNRKYKNDVLYYPVFELVEPYTFANLTVQSGRPNSAQVWEFNRTPLVSIPHTALRFRSLDEIGLNGISKLLNLASVLAKRA